MCDGLKRRFASQRVPPKTWAAESWRPFFASGAVRRRAARYDPARRAARQADAVHVRLPTRAKGQRDPEKAARRLLKIANAVEPVQGHIHIEKINEPFLFRDRGSPAE